MRVLVVGRTGQIATELTLRLPRAGHEVLALEPPDLNITSAASLRAVLRDYRPHAVINAAAYTAVDKAEDDAELAFAINRDGPGLLSEETAALGVPVVHYSTDYVFDGTKATPYTEADAPNPVGIYGQSKLAGEQALLAANPCSVVLRTAWVCSAHGGNFVTTMLHLGRERAEVGVVDDQHGAPTFADDLADAAIALLPRLVAAQSDDTGFGVFHLSGCPYTTWHGFAAAIFDGAAKRNQPVPQLRAICTADYPTRARRPASSRLDCSRITEVHGIRPADWRDGLERCLTTLLGAEREIG